MASILVVDDDPGMARAMTRALEREGHRVSMAGDGRVALDRLASAAFDLVVTDLRMPGLDGRGLVENLNALYPGVPALVVTAYASVESAVQCVRAGASDYLQKPFSPAALAEAARKLLAQRGRRSDSAEPPLVARDPATLKVVELAKRAARSEATVLLEAESGAGKEVFARFIHRESRRRSGPFVAVNCAALPRELLEAELFGHTRGAFTGAVRDRKGQFQSAHGGTLFLDEIGEMCPELQTRLLRVIQHGEVRPVGSDEPVRVDVRLVAATHRDLRCAVREGRFREDLYYRICVLPVRIPPLRERPGDIEPLALRFLEHYGGEGATVSPRALKVLRGHAWPGNVRELQNVIQRAVVLAGEPVRIEPEHLQLEPLEPAGLPRAGSEPSSLTLEDAEWHAIRKTLLETGGNRTRAAAALGISARTLRHKLQRYREQGRPVLEAGA